MNGDDITDAFTRWRLAHDAFLAAEQQFFNNARTRAHQFCTTTMHESDPLFVEVQVKRAHAEGLLLAAMKILHEHRTQGAHNPNPNSNVPGSRVAASPTSPPSGG